MYRHTPLNIVSSFRHILIHRSDGYMREWISPSLGQMMVRHLICFKPLPESMPIIVNWTLKTKFREIRIERVPPFRFDRTVLSAVLLNISTMFSTCKQYMGICSGQRLGRVRITHCPYMFVQFRRPIRLINHRFLSNKDPHYKDQTVLRPSCTFIWLVFALLYVEV